MKMDAAYRQSNTLGSSLDVEAGVLPIPDYVKFPTLGRTQNGVHAVLANCFDFSIPLFVWQYPRRSDDRQTPPEELYGMFSWPDFGPPKD